MPQKTVWKKTKNVTESAASRNGDGNRHFEEFSSSGLFSVF